LSRGQTKGRVLWRKESSVQRVRLYDSDYRREGKLRRKEKNPGRKGFHKGKNPRSSIKKSGDSVIL